jgi:hypothetical protein
VGGDVPSASSTNWPNKLSLNALYAGHDKFCALTYLVVGLPVMDVSASGGWSRKYSGTLRGRSTLSNSLAIIPSHFAKVRLTGTTLRTFKSRFDMLSHATWHVDPSFEFT